VTDENLTQMSLTMPDTAATEPEVTPAVRRAADVLFAAEVAGLILDDVRAGLIAALDVDEIARALARVAWKQRIESGLIHDDPWDVDLDTLTPEARRQHCRLQSHLVRLAQPHAEAIVAAIVGAS
jgi:hypothetical protein